MLNRLMNWWRGRKKPAARLNPLILRTTEGSLHARKPEVQNPSQIEVAEAEMNIAMRTVLNVMAIEGLITREQAKEFTETHAVVVAYRGCGLSGLLKGIGTPEDDIKANRSRIVVVRLPVRSHYSDGLHT